MQRDTAIFHLVNTAVGTGASELANDQLPQADWIHALSHYDLLPVMSSLKSWFRSWSGPFGTGLQIGLG